MPSETELRDALHSAGAEVQPIDTAQIIRGVRRRRLPRQLATGLVATLAVVGIGFAGVQGVRSIVPTSGSSTTSADAPESAIDGGTSVDSGSGTAGPLDGTSGNPGSGVTQAAPAEKLNLCGGSLAEVAPSVTGLILTPIFPATAPAGADPVTGSVRLTNTGETRVTGTTAASPSMTLSSEGTVIWHTNGPSISLAMTVDLLPGQSIQYPASFTPVVCSIADDSAESFSDDLPAAAAGSYQLSAAILFTPEPLTSGPIDPSSDTTDQSPTGDGTGDPASENESATLSGTAGELITGDPVPITLG